MPRPNGPDAAARLCVALVLTVFARTASAEGPAAPTVSQPSPPTIPTPASGETPTFNRHVAPLLFARCSICHRPGEIGPFPLLTYADAKKRARQLADITARKTMPPWKPEPGHGEFLDERRLTDAEIAVFANWAEAGAPEGDRADLPPTPKFPTGWRLGTPDLVLRMPEKFTIPAEGRDIYQHFVFPLNLSADRYVRAIEVRPSNPRVAHHAIGLLDISGNARKFEALAKAMGKGPGYPGLGSQGFIPAGLTPGYVPGATPRPFPPDMALTLKKGMDFVLQMHYHPTGKKETDLTEVGLYFTDRKPERNPAGLLMGSEDIDIPAGAKDWRRRDVFVLPVNLSVTDVWCHMHMVGKEVHVRAELPDGTSKSLLKITDWDFNWQDTYRYKERVRLPKGTRIVTEWVFDNSADNPRNPNHPPKRVTHGEMSTDEMAGLWVGGVCDNWVDELSLLGAVVGHFFEVKKVGDEAKKARTASEAKAKPTAKR
jgi:mono/diheme cytochrome c family protein